MNGWEGVEEKREQKGRVCMRVDITGTQVFSVVPQRDREV